MLDVGPILLLTVAVMVLYNLLSFRMSKFFEPFRHELAREAHDLLASGDLSPEISSVVSSIPRFLYSRRTVWTVLRMSLFSMAGFYKGSPQIEQMRSDAKQFSDELPDEVRLLIYNAVFVASCSTPARLFSFAVVVITITVMSRRMGSGLATVFARHSSLAGSSC